MCIIVHDVCRTIVDFLLPWYIHFPSGEDLQRTVDGFHAVWDVPQCAGAIDFSHIPILGPAENHTDQRWRNHGGSGGRCPHKNCPGEEEYPHRNSR